MTQTINGGLLISSKVELSMIKDAVEFWLNSQHYVESQWIGDYDLPLYVKLAEELTEHIVSYLDTKADDALPDQNSNRETTGATMINKMKLKEQLTQELKWAEDRYVASLDDSKPEYVSAHKSYFNGKMSSLFTAIQLLEDALPD